jgi:hypothetical protein
MPLTFSAGRNPELDLVCSGAEGSDSFAIRRILPTAYAANSTLIGRVVSVE